MAALAGSGALMSMGSAPPGVAFMYAKPSSLGGEGVAEELHLDAVRVQEVNAAGHAVVDDVVDDRVVVNQPLVSLLKLIRSPRP